MTSSPVCGKAEALEDEALGVAALRAEALGVADADLLPLEALLVSRAYLYTLFHKVFGGEPSVALLAIMGHPVTVDVLDEYSEKSETLAHLKEFSARIGLRANDAPFLEEAREEFARFFEGPADCVAFPWEGPYLTNEATVFQPSVLSVRDAYRKQGLQVKWFERMPDDHVAIMCAFMGVLAQRTLAAFRKGDAGRMKSLLLDQYAFLGSHMVTWLPRYAELSLKVKKACIYPQFIQGIAAFVELDKTFAAEALAWAEEKGGCLRVQSDVFSEVNEAFGRLIGLRLVGLEDNELVPID